MLRVLPLLALLAAEVLHATPPPPIVLWKSSPEMVDKTAHSVPPTNPERFALLQKSFNEADCRDQDFEAETVPHSQLKNLVCTMQGNTPEVIVVAAHYELEGRGTAAVDDWSGAIMLPMIYKAIRATVPDHTFIFVEFAGKEGARAYMERMTKKQRKSILGMVGLEALGIGDVQFWGNPNNGPTLQEKETTLGSILDDAADLVGQGVQRPVMERVWGSLKVDDTEEFHDANIPALLIHSIHLRDRKLPGSELDTVDAIDTTFYYQTYELLSTYCVQLDRTLDQKFSIRVKGRSAEDETHALPRKAPSFRVSALPPQ